MEDRELLEAAAKAAGMKPFKAWGLAFVDGAGLPPKADWNPLTDDGDALRLAVALDIKMTPGSADSPYAAAEWWVRPELIALDFERVLVGGDRAAALRRAVVLAAAAIGAAPVLGAA